MGQYIDSGKDTDGRFWLIIKDVAAGPPPMFTLSQVLDKKKGSGKAACLDALKKAKALTVSESKQWAESKKIL